MSKKQTDTKSANVEQKSENELGTPPLSGILPFDTPTPHAAIEAVIKWLGIGYQSEITRRSDGKKITIRITGEN
jgi:hypothetical protein